MTRHPREQSYANAQDQSQIFLDELLVKSHNLHTFSILSKDIRDWSKHAPKVSFSHKVSFFNSSAFIKKLTSEKKLKQYLQPSIAYLFVRDLDLDLSQQEVIDRIDTLATHLAKQLRLDRQTTISSNEPDIMLQGFRWAKDHDADQAFIWLSAKIYRLKQELPASLVQHQGIRKLLKVVAGVLMNQWQKDNNNANFEQAIRLGYYYGLTYPLIDDLQDSHVLSQQQKENFDYALEQSILQGQVLKPIDQDSWLNYVFDELAEAFTFIKKQQGEHFDLFLDQAYIFLKSQQHAFRQPSSEYFASAQIWLDMINKSSRSRILADALVSSQIKLGNYQYFGLLNQLHDDFKDVELDYQEGNVTPFVALIYFNKTYHGIQPYRLYWALLHHLIYQCYDNESQIKQLLIKRCINAHQSLLEELGKERFYNRIQLLSRDCEELKELLPVLLEVLEMPLEMAWLDKYFSRQLQQQLQQEQAEGLNNRIENIQSRIQQELALLESNGLERAGNYSLSAGGKYFRGVLCVLYGQDCLNLTFEQLTPIVRFIEYMHTASLIFDDKPSQDNSDLRRGKATLHHFLQSESKAEVAALNLIFKAVEVHAGITNFEADNVLKSLTYASQLSQKICYGQWLDLDSQGKMLSIDELETISLHKTAYALESALILPALLTGQSQPHIATLQKYAYHLGIAFQIKDDLLDVESTNATLGKPVNLDKRNQTSTYVRCLGRQGATEQLYQHYYQAIDEISQVDNAKALIQMATWVVNRKS